MVWLIEINGDKCEGDGDCVNLCPVQCLELQGSDKKKAVAVRSEDCTGCMCCVTTCSQGAISVNEI